MLLINTVVSNLEMWKQMRIMKLMKNNFVGFQWRKKKVDEVQFQQNKSVVKSIKRELEIFQRQFDFSIKIWIVQAWREEKTEEKLSIFHFYVTTMISKYILSDRVIYFLELGFIKLQLLHTSEGLSSFLLTEAHFIQ